MAVMVDCKSITVLGMPLMRKLEHLALFSQSSILFVELCFFFYVLKFSHIVQRCSAGAQLSYLFSETISNVL